MYDSALLSNGLRGRQMKIYCVKDCGGLVWMIRQHGEHFFKSGRTHKPMQGSW